MIVVFSIPRQVTAGIRGFPNYQNPAREQTTVKILVNAGTSGTNLRCPKRNGSSLRCSLSQYFISRNQTKNKIIFSASTLRQSHAPLHYFQQGRQQ